MGHKVHPTGIRLGISKDWNSKWYANKGHYAEFLIADLKVRELLQNKLKQAGVSRIQIERPANNARITIHTARPGVVIGKKGEDIEALRAELRKRMGLQSVDVAIEEVRKPEVDAQLIAE
uniref:30S ribosomal protein S3 n=1 Tax=Oleiagrimonas sp. TaxID=2010330 RepID=UPI0026049E69